MRSWYMDVFSELAANDVKFVVAGGIAVNLLGVPRFTADLDLIVALERENVVKFAQCMTRLGFKPKVPVPAEAFADPENRKRWIAEKNMRVFSFQKPDLPYEVVDVFVNEPIPFADMWRDKETITLDNITIPIVSIDHLIQLKREAMRLQDMSDIEALEKLKEELANDKG
ncbi:MAG: hypothetical protein V2A66_09510 [Pseudomonadota bacterium]